MIYAGYISDIAIFSKNIGGFGMTFKQVSQNILNHFIIPVAALLLVTTSQLPVQFVWGLDLLLHLSNSSIKQSILFNQQFIASH